MRYKDLKQPINHIPKELNDIKITCENCNRKYPIDWLRSEKEPFIPIIPNDNKGIWRPSGKLFNCIYCGHSNVARIPKKDVSARYLLYGDEAYREYGDKIVVTYTLVGINRKFVSIINKKISDFKLKYFPNLPPDSWKIHMKEIWSFHTRKKTIFKEFSQDKLTLFVDDLLRLIKNLENGFIIYNCSSITKRPVRFTKQMQNKKKVDIYSLLIMRIIDEMTSQGIRPELIFDSEKPGNGENIIHEWADKAFKGAQTSFLYAYISGGNQIPEPRFVTPASYPCLEIADVVSYVVARYCYKKMKKENIDIDLSKLGKMYYLGFEKNIDFVYCYQDKYPWELFYG